LVRVVEVWLRQEICMSGERRFLMDWTLKEHSRQLVDEAKAEVPLGSDQNVN